MVQVMKVRQLTFRLLQVYADVVRTGSITATANRLHLTQPTVSQQLKRLREIVGESIVRQEDGRVVPTEVGQALYQLSQDLLSRADVFSQYVEEYSSGGRGHFSIGLVNTAQYVLPRLLGPFNQANPQVDITVEIGNRQQMLNRFERHEDDLYVFSHPPLDDEVLAAPFLSNPLVVVGPEASHWADVNDLTMEALKTSVFCCANQAPQPGIPLMPGCTVRVLSCAPPSRSPAMRLFALPWPRAWGWRCCPGMWWQMPPKAFKSCPCRASR